MIFHYLRIALRYALRQRTYTLINILGLCLGITASILICFWVLDEISYDNYFNKAGRIHKLDLYCHTPQTRIPYPMALF